MKIAIIGYGKMGRMIESTALEKGHEIGSCIDINNQELMAPESLGKHDVAIEFTRPDTAFNNISKCLDAGVPVVSGTTGWNEGLEKLVERCRLENGAFLYASNFSLGVNILFHLNRQLAGIMNLHPVYDVSMKEIHHTRKLDAPSGTALTLAGDVLAAVDRKKDWALEEPDAASHETLWIEAVREGSVPGVHEISWESEFDSLGIRHSAKDRRGFVNGAILAAEFLHDKKGFYTMKEVLDL
jgi:4-hydroxy-tetrahydrodipicolinate reductase